MKKCALVGSDVSYSYSKIIHEYIAKLKGVTLEYDLISIDDISKFNFNEYEGINITIPYKEEVLKFVNELSEEVREIGNANTIDSNLKAYNTDILGLKYALEDLVGPLKELSRVVVLGNSSTAQMIKILLAEQDVLIVSRTPIENQISYDQLEEFYGDLIINTTPVTMKSLDASPVGIEHLKNFKYVYDLNYNPSNNKFLTDACALNILHDNGLLMLIMQAVYAFEIWHNVKLSEFERVCAIDFVKQLVWPKTALIGMPYSGKSTYGKKKMNNGERVIDLDEEITEKIGDIAKYIKQEGIEKFRQIETKVLSEVINDDYDYLICGGGVVENIANYQLLSEHQIKHMACDFEILVERMNKSQKVSGQIRPLTNNENDLKMRYDQRKIKYKIWSKNSIIN